MTAPMNVPSRRRVRMLVRRLAGVSMDDAPVQHAFGAGPVRSSAFGRPEVLPLLQRATTRELAANHPAARHGNGWIRVG